MGASVPTGEEKGKTWPQYLAVLSALFAMFNSGLHFGWPSPSIPKILSDEYLFNVTEEEASYITIIGPIGDIVGSVAYPAMVDVIGRKNTILLIAVPQIISMSMIYFSYFSKKLLYTARFIGGLSEAACFAILPLYIGEVAEPKVRGVLGSLFSLFLILGVVVVNFIGSYVNLHTAALIFTILPVLFLGIFSQMPESPYFLIMKSNMEGAEQSLKKLRRKYDVHEELKSLINDVNRQMSEPGKYKDLYTIKSNRMACIVMFGLRLIQQLSGTSAFMFYMQVLFEKSSNFLSKDIASSIIFALQLSINVIALLVVDKAGRKPLLIVSCFGCFLALIFETIYFIIQDFTNIDVSSADYVPLIGLVLFTITFAIGQGNVINLMVGEMFSSSIKAKASAIMNILFAISMALSTKFYQYTADNFGMCVPFFVFALCQLLGTGFCIWYVPETKGKTLEEIQQELKGTKKEDKIEPK